VNTTRSILVVEDESDLASTLCYQLERAGFRCRIAPDGHSAIAQVQQQLPDLVILDRMLPGISGDQVAMRLRSDARTARIPIIMLTARAEETDELIGFALGADDYVRKPFSMKLLLARIEALLRRQEGLSSSADVLHVGPIVLDRERHEVTVEGRPVTLTVTEFRLLSALLLARGRVLSRDQLIDAALGTTAVVTERTIDVHVSALRKKLGEAGRWVRTIRGVGYALRAPAEDEAGNQAGVCGA
jgi:two-component system phosphate regulon response regulator PhoB